jgi:hypothetical protein
LHPEAPVNEHRAGFPASIHEAQPVVALFAWRGNGIVLLGEHEGDRWIVARAWRQGDALTDVRRWSFAAPAMFSGQIRRLVFEASGDPAAAKAAGADARSWADALA